METFKYYRRGQGELDTSNFPEIVAQGEVTVDRLDEKTFTSLSCFMIYLRLEKVKTPFPLKIKGYVNHMRADKDLYDPAKHYSLLSSIFNIECYQVQHDSRYGIVSAKVDPFDVMYDLELDHKWCTLFVGADSSVPKFFPSIDTYANKVRENGKVVSLDFDMPKKHQIKRVVIVDDLLGGGATVKMLVDKIKESGYKGEVYLWVQYNEGIHKGEFLNQFNGYYIGQDISK